MPDPDITALRERYEYDLNGWRDIRKEGDEDMRHVAGDPWNPKERRAREKAKRPCLALDELNQYFNQAINDVRANPRAAKFSPTGNGANDQTAEFYGNKWREIEYRSKAHLAYTAAYENAVQRGYGFVRLETKWTHARSFDQDLWIVSVVNPNQMVPDADALMPDSSDARHWWVIESRNRKEFTHEFPKAKVVDFDAAAMRTAPDWIQGERIQIAEHWKIRTTLRNLLLIQPPPAAGVSGSPAAPPPIALFEDELDVAQLPPGATVIRTDEREWPTVYACLTNGLEILKEIPWAGKYLPFASCYGKVIYVDDGGGAKRHILSMTRLARSPYMLYCYIRTCEAEIIGAVPRNSWRGYKGQFEGFEQEWERANREPVSYLEINATTEATGATVLPLPQREPWDPPLQNIEIAAEAARRAIQAAMGSFPLPTQAQRRNDKSGKAIQRIEEITQKGNFHFVDAYNALIEHMAVMGEDVMDKYYDSAREVGIRKADESAEIIRINDPQDEQSVSTKGDHLVTISTGPSHDSQREEAAAFADGLVGTPFAPLIGDLLVKLRQLGPLGDEMADRLTPPQFRTPKDGHPDPAQVQQMLGLLQQENEQLKATLNELSLDLKTQKLKLESDERIAQAEIASRERIARGTARTDVVTTDADNTTKLVLAKLDAQLELMLARLEQRDAALQRAHEGRMAETQHAHALETGDQAVVD